MHGTESAFWAGIFDALDSGLIVLDSDGCVLTWNAWMTVVTGTALQEAAGKRLGQLFPSSTLRRLNAAVTDAIQLGASSLLTHSLHPSLLPLQTRMGRTLIHDLSVRPVGEKPYQYCLIQIFDVSIAAERDQVLRARQNARYAAVVDNAPDAILTIDTEGLIQFANPAAADVFHCPTPTLVGRPVVDLFENQDAWIATWHAALTGEAQGRPQEFVIHRADGTSSFVEVSAFRWTNDSRAFVSVILRDVNERHAAEESLRRLNETLEERVAINLAERRVLADIVENTDAFIQVLGLDYRLLAVNRASAAAFERMFGKRPVVGMNILDLLADHPADQALTQTLWARAFAGEAFTTIQEFGASTGNRRFYEFKFNALRDAAGVQFAAFQFVYDVTDRLEEQAQLARTEEALRQSQKMEAIGQLTGGIAHDFNNLLTGIIGAMDIVKRRLAMGRQEDVQRFMDAATASANRAAALTHRLLAFARRQPLDTKATDVNQLIRGIEDFLRRTLGERVALTVELDPDLWPTLTDANQLENSIINLAINARDAMPGGGSLTITTKRVVVEYPILSGSDEIQPGDYTVIQVCDTGTGIDPAALPKVFEPFYTTKPLGQGTGLGLSMIYGFVKQTQGNVQIESTLGQGTSVSLYFRRYHGPLDVKGPRLHHAAPRGEGETVLLVEDDSSVRLLIGEVLRDLGYACIEAIDGQAAVPILSSNVRLDLMITDVGLPGLDGRQLADFARHHRPDLRILFVTGYAEHVTSSENILGVNMEMVTKPFTLDALAFKIRDMLAATVE
ncbi:PAS domain-containing protein [Acidisphaera sp. S103]|uniref:PAS domain-containing hybrid sensor histidine kinase/response regulator n=1 Tax=Acidisphaera sp. S103 TaxID=1747223 RepID=UPI00131C410A|nr:PAS domain-containing protein [Acidisphaera sp. S103]